MFPIRDHNPSGRTPIVCWSLIAINVAVFLGYWHTIPGDRAMMIFFDTWGLVPAAVVQGEDWHGFLTSMFLHGGWMHLIGNMLFLWIFGDNIEDELGHLRFLGFYLLAGFLAAAGQVVAEPYSPIPMVGASGAIAGVLGAYLVMFPRAKVDVLIIIVIFFRIFPVPAWIMLCLWFGLQLLGGFSTPSDEGGVAYWAHAGGFLAGMVLILPVWIARGGPGFWSRTHGTPPHPEARYAVSKSRVPQVPRR
ncbi:MAG: rhomboid family intramembrane serine protease [Paracoccaceae bacterium]|nr:MAG: rhomboid family intramembrane serine protease [Paracoccaceae bacterium]